MPDPTPPPAPPPVSSAILPPGLRGDLIQAESGGQNAINAQEGAEGFYQITGPTWQDFAPRAGVDLKQYPTASVAPYAVQSKVADSIPMGRWGPRTQRILAAKYGTLDPRQPMGTFAQQFGGGPGTNTGAAPGVTPQPAPGPVDLSQMPTVPDPTTGATPVAMTPPGGAPATPISLAPQGAPPSLGDALTRMAQSWQSRLNPQGSP